jgi:predicted XRE-type DNA-binding protein
VRVEVFIKGESGQLSQKAMVELCGVKNPAVSKLLANFFEMGEL